MQDVNRQYYKRMGMGLLAYSVLLWASMQLTSAYPDALWRFPVALAPMAPFVYGIFACVRYVQRIDEFQRIVALEALAIAFGGTAAITFGYGFLELAGLPHVNWTFVWAGHGSLLAVGYRDRRATISMRSKLEGPARRAQLVPGGDGQPPGSLAPDGERPGDG